MYRGMVTIFLLLGGTIPLGAQGDVATTPQVLPWSWVIYVLAGLAISNVAAWIREWRKHKDWKAKNGAEKEVLKAVNMIHEKTDGLIVGQVELKQDLGLAKTELRTEVRNIKSNCSRVSSEVKKNIEANTEKIFELARKE